MFNRKTLFPREMYEEFTKAATMAIIFLLLLLGSALLTYLLTDSEYSFASALFESGSAQGTVGLSSGITDPSMSPFLELI